MCATKAVDLRGWSGEVARDAQSGQPPAPALPDQPPRLSTDQAAEISRTHFGISGVASPLPSERDQNFRITSESSESFVLKLAQATDDRALLECQSAVIQRLDAAGTRFRFPRIRTALNGESIAEITENGAAHLARMVEYTPGVPLANVRPHTRELLRDVGALLGTVDRMLQGFRHPAAERDFHWDVRNARAMVTANLPDIGDAGRRALIESFAPLLELPSALVAALRKSVIHNDGNDHNLIVQPPTLADPFAPPALVGLIDFGDVVHSWTLAEVAIAASYAMLDKPDPLRAASDVVAGYHHELPIPEAELEALLPLICARLCQSVVLAAAQRKRQPENEYLSVSEQPAWALLELLRTVDPTYAHFRFRQACGLEACPTSARVAAWLRHDSRQPAPILPHHDLAAAPVLDFGAGSLEFGEVAWTDDATAWTAAVFGFMRDAGAQVGLGRYEEARPWYTSAAFRSDGLERSEWRSVHIGVDIFAAPGTAVSAPLAGTVHALRDNADALDYGPTIVLRHEIEPDVAFFTLYGHLSRESLMQLQPGSAVERGQRFATIGDANVNGGWAPHLHFQLITNLLGRDHEFPGVARPSDLDLWRSVSPDPNLVLRLPQLQPATRQAPDTLLAERRERIGSALSVAYRKPLVLLRGWMQYLYDQDGQPYLDAVNNVAHVGHSHPRVVEALRRQATVLNTNTRYLHENLARYAERLTATLPEPLRVCYFVCSGSEANELALRLARTHTRANDIVVIDGAYHGNTSALIELSPYKFNGPGGMGPPPHLQVVPLPDVFRGRYRGTGTDLGAQYAVHVRNAIDNVDTRGRRVAAFLVEAMPGCGGQIVLPEGYLREAFAHVRSAGGVCIADEVQTGLGRVGSHVWAFETQGVVPDIVTMGKPLGNGHPLAAVVTTPEIAASFNNGMEYFNTFGGNPVSCAVGLAVLDVIEEAGLQANALNVGNHLLDRLRELQPRHPIIGDVRGQGLYIGVELVLDHDKLTPAGACASYVANRMRDRGILISTDGPDHNVLKIKPPLVFSEANADLLAERLDEVLFENAVRLS